MTIKFLHREQKFEGAYCMAMNLQFIHKWFPFGLLDRVAYYCMPMNLQFIH